MALGRTATQGPTASTTNPASLAVDGDTSGASGTCTESTGGDNWWAVELDKSYTIISVTLFNTVDTASRKFFKKFGIFKVAGY